LNGDSITKKKLNNDSNGVEKFGQQQSNKLNQRDRSIEFWGNAYSSNGKAGAGRYNNEEIEDL